MGHARRSLLGGLLVRTHNLNDDGSNYEASFSLAIHSLKMQRTDILSTSSAIVPTVESVSSRVKCHMGSSKMHLHCGWGIRMWVVEILVAQRTVLSENRRDLTL